VCGVWTGVLFQPPWRLVGGGLCWRERAQAPTLKEVHKEQVGLAMHDSATATQKEILARVIFFLFLVIFFFHFCFLLFFFFFFS
jgi:hypothetical protein